MSYKVKQYKKMTTGHYRVRESTEQKIVKAILKGLWWLISAPFKLIFALGGKKKNPGTMQTHEDVSLDRQFVIERWQTIEQLMQLGGPSNYARAVLEADKLLDHLLKGHRAPGLTMGDRLKASEKKFSSDGYNCAWRGHKIRNEIAHNTQYEVTDFIARDAIENYKRAIGELI